MRAFARSLLHRMEKHHHGHHDDRPRMSASSGKSSVVPHKLEPMNLFVLTPSVLNRSPHGLCTLHGKLSPSNNHIEPQP